MFGDASVVSWSKDSIYVSWKFDVDNTATESAGVNATLVRGYKIRYQAVGSSVVQYTRLLDRSVTDYEITHLHENTNYDICVLRLEASSFRDAHHSVGGAPAAAVAMHSTGRGGAFAGSRALSAAAVACVTGTTSTDSLSVALGSTFGAFLALGFIVGLVFLAKWQHSRRLAKQFAGLPLDNVYFDNYNATFSYDHSFGDSSIYDIARIYGSDVSGRPSLSDENQLPFPADVLSDQQPRPSTSRENAEVLVGGSATVAAALGRRRSGGDITPTPSCSRRREWSPTVWPLPIPDDQATPALSLHDHVVDTDDDDDDDVKPCYISQDVNNRDDSSRSSRDRRGKQPADKSRAGVAKNRRRPITVMTSETVTSSVTPDVMMSPVTPVSVGDGEATSSDAK